MSVWCESEVSCLLSEFALVVLAGDGMDGWRGNFDERDQMYLPRRCLTPHPPPPASWSSSSTHYYSPSPTFTSQSIHLFRFFSTSQYSPKHIRWPGLCAASPCHPGALVPASCPRPRPRAPTGGSPQRTRSRPSESRARGSDHLGAPVSLERCDVADRSLLPSEMRTSKCV